MLIAFIIKQICVIPMRKIYMCEKYTCCLFPSYSDPHNCNVSKFRATNKRLVFHSIFHSICTFVSPVIKINYNIFIKKKNSRASRIVAFRKSEIACYIAANLYKIFLPLKLKRIFCHLSTLDEPMHV